MSLFKHLVFSRTARRLGMSALILCLSVPVFAASSRDLSSLDNTIQNWGQGVQFNSRN